MFCPKSTAPVLCGGLLLLAALAAGCGGSDREPAPPPPPILAPVALPASVDTTALAVTAGNQRLSVAADDSVQLQQAVPGPVLVLAESAGVPVAWSLFSPDRTDNSISCLESATTLVLVSTGLIAADPIHLAELAAIVAAEPTVVDLADLLCAELAQDPTAFSRPSANLLLHLAQAGSNLKTKLLAMVQAAAGGQP